MIWPPSMLARFVVLLRDKSLSYADIAQTLSREFSVRLTKNAVIGMGHRQKEVRDESKVGRKRKPRDPFATKPPKQKKKKPKPPKPRPLIYVQDLLPNDCRWPYGDRHPYTFCGHPQIEGSSYCKDHTAQSRGYR
jgi:GcrA cell cycle regulator